MWIQVGERIGKIRRDLNLSRAQFSRMIGRSEQYIGKIERGAGDISGDAIAKICNLTGASSDYILFGVSSTASIAEELSGLSYEQIGICLDILRRIAQMISSDNGNDALIQEIFRQQHTLST